MDWSVLVHFGNTAGYNIVAAGSRVTMAHRNNTTINRTENPIESLSKIPYSNISWWKIDKLLHKRLINNGINIFCPIET